MNLRVRMRRTPQRILTSLILGLALTTLAGCTEDSYPGELRYPLRGDAMVGQGKSLTSTPKTTDRPGELSRIFSIYLSEEDRKKLVDPNELDPAQRGKLEKALLDIFGTPARPTIKDLTESVQNALAPIENETLALGSKLYRQHCLHCHGLVGDGRGPTAAWVNPHPRDFRKGFFKFTSVSSVVSSGERRARRADILRVLRDGNEDASMPSFRLLPDRELEAMVSYVIHLSLRGQVEGYILDGLARKDTEILDNVEGQVADMTAVFAQFWLKTQGNPIQPGAYVPMSKESVQRGMKVFLDKGDPKNPGAASAACISCHLDFGRAATYRFDDWGTIVRPSDLTMGRYRGGRRPLDLYYRVHSGINGVGMPPTTLVKDAGKPNPDPDPVWDLVNFLQVLPFPDQHARYGVNVDTTLVSGKDR